MGLARDGQLFRAPHKSKHLKSEKERAVGGMRAVVPQRRRKHGKGEGGQANGY
jgi:hypothetical protein